MKKILAVALASVMSIALLSGCAEETTSNTQNDTNKDNEVVTTDTSLDDIVEKGKLVLGLDDSFPPMGFRNEDNEIVGFDIDLAQAVAEKLGVELVLQPVDWESKEFELDSYNIDCIWNGMSINESRKEAMNMSEAYLANEIVFVVRANDGIESVEDLEGKIVAVQSGSSAQEIIESDEELMAKIDGCIEFSTFLTALLDLEVQGVDAILMDSVVAQYQIATSGKDFTIMSGYVEPEFYGIGFRKNDIALGDAVWNALEELKTEGVVAQIAEEWFGEDVTLIQ